MAIFHRKDSIKEIKQVEAGKKAPLMATGQQLTKLTVELAKKNQVIETLGKQAAATLLEVTKLKKEIQELKGDK